MINLCHAKISINLLHGFFFQGKFNFPSDVEVSNDAKDLMQRLVY